MARALAALAAIALLLGCSSVRSWNRGCPGIYSGVRYAHERTGQVPLDGKIFFTLDLPLSAVVDTLALPATAFAEPKRPRGGFPAGCGWAGHR